MRRSEGSEGDGRPEPGRNASIRNIALALGAIVALLLLGEAAFRLVKGTLGNPWAHAYDPELGWAPRPGFEHHFPGDPNNRDTGPVRFRTDRHGFRRWGDAESHRPRFLFVGDSFTYPENVSDDETYYAYFAEHLPVEVFAIGGSGYGTLQELLLARRVWDLVRPDYFVLQFCTNDFMNNHLPSEDLSFARLQKSLRPFLVDGRIEFRDAPAFRLLVRYSELFRFLDTRIERVQVAIHGNHVPEADRIELDRLLPTAEAATLAILEHEYPPLAGSAEGFTFSCNERDRPKVAAWLRVVRAVGLQPIEGVAGAVEAAEDRGMVVRGADGAHWNDRGHEIVGQALVDFFAPRLGMDLGP